MLWECLECSTRYAWDLQACPGCGSDHREESGMPKITVANGATHAPVEKEKEEPEWPGNPSSASTKKPSSTPETSETTRPKPARSTGSRSKKAREASSSASSVTTDGPETDAFSD
jgi:hypothetical protein